MITAEKLNKICPSIKGDRAIKIAGLLDSICPKYGIDFAGIFHEFIANVLEENWEFNHMEENLNYRAERLMVVWPGRFPNMTIAAAYAHNPKKLANKVYGGRMGNTQPDDGWQFRGGGSLMITGRDMYLLFTSFYNKTFGTQFTVAEISDRVRTDLEISIHSACWVFVNVKKLIPLAKEDKIKEIVLRINGGLTNMVKRMEYYQRAKIFIT